MLNKPRIFETPNAVSSLNGGEMDCSGNTCASGFSCSSVDSSGGDGCKVGFAVGGIIFGTAAGAGIGIAIT